MPDTPDLDRAREAAGLLVEMMFARGATRAEWATFIAKWGTEQRAQEAERLADEPYVGSQIAYHTRERAAELRAQIKSGERQ